MDDGADVIHSEFYLTAQHRVVPLLRYLPFRFGGVLDLHPIRLLRVNCVQRRGLTTKHCQCHKLVDGRFHPIEHA